MTISNNTHTKNIIHNLPLEIWINSLEFLPLENILTFQKSCTTFKKIVPIALWSQAKTTPEFPLEVIKKTGFNSEKTYKPVIAKEMNMMFAVCNLDFSFKKNFMICATANNCLTILSQKFELLRNLDHRLDIDFSNAKISPDGTKIACSKFNTQIVRNADSCTSVAILIDPESTVIPEFRGHTKAITSVSFSPDSKTLVTGSENEIKIWDIESRRCSKTISVDAPVASIAFVKSGEKIVFTEKTVLKVWDLTQQILSATYPGHTNSISCMDVHQKYNIAATGASDRTIKIWHLEKAFTDPSHSESTLSDLPTDASKLTLKGHTHEIRSVKFSPSGACVASASLDQTIKIWDSFSGQLKNSINGFSPFGGKICFTPDGTKILAPCFFSSFRVLEIYPLLEDLIISFLNKLTPKNELPEAIRNKTDEEILQIGAHTIIQNTCQNADQLFHLASNYCLGTFMTETLEEIENYPQSLKLAVKLPIAEKFQQLQARKTKN